MSKSKFSKLLKQRITELAFKYLTGKQRSKGKEIKYEKLHMSEYLQPNEQGLSIEDQRYLFAVRNRMVDIPANFPQKNKNENRETCICGQVEDMVHIYSCTKLNKSEEINCEEFANIYSGNLNK